MRCSLLVVSVVGLAACGFDGSEATEDGPIEDLCTPGFLDLCDQQPRAGAFSLPPQMTRELDTDSDPLCTVLTQPEGGPVCLLYFERVVLEGELLVSGSRPFALAARDDVQLSGSLDASSRRTRARPGAGGERCAFRAVPGSSKDGGGGGAGGTFLSLGGNGGDGNEGRGGGGGGGGEPTPGGRPPLEPVLPPSALRGGCNGQTGGDGNIAGGGGSGIGGPGGAAGGAIYLSGRSIALSGKLLATGAGGTGGNLAKAGGGGGGSGGMIVIQSPRLSISGLLLASGGGGGEGADQNLGSPGADPVSISPAVGGATRPMGGDGGNGAGLVAAPGLDGGDGGGGGGGGNGQILLLTTAPGLNGQLAPAPTIRPR
jgi:hypothetical protein